MPGPRRRRAEAAPVRAGHSPRGGLLRRRRRSGKHSRRRRPGTGHHRRGARGCRRRAAPARAGPARRRAGAGRLRRDHHRHLRHASAAVGRAEADGQHHGQRPGTALRRRARRVYDVFRRRSERPQSHQPHRARQRRPGDGRYGEAEQRPLHGGIGRQAVGDGHHVRSHDAVRRVGASRRRAGRLRGAGLPRHGDRRTDHGIAHPRRRHRRGAGRHHDGAGRRAGGRPR
jgi:hypothetical protein